MAFCASVERALKSQGYVNVRTVSDPWQALESVQQERPDLILLDLYLSIEGYSQDRQEHSGDDADLRDR